MEYFIFNQEAKIEKVMYASFGIHAESFEQAKEIMHKMLRTESGGVRHVCDVPGVKVSTDMVSNKEYKVVDGSTCMFTCYKHPEYEEKGVIDTKP